jgi:transcriptional regulator of heat shock response
MTPQARQHNLLRIIIENYIRTARPVSSKALVEESGLEYSPATIRNDMAELEQAGLIMQPHTSAGRVPTEAGYQYYIKYFIAAPDLDRHRRQQLSHALEREMKPNPYQRLKHAAKAIADVTDEAVIISFIDDNFYTGLSHAVRKPDFADGAALVSLTQMLERLDEVMEAVRLNHQTHDLQILVGHDNPWFAEGSLILRRTTIATGDGVQTAVVGIVGPMRMDYATNLAVLSTVAQFLNK